MVDNTGDSVLDISERKRIASRIGAQFTELIEKGVSPGLHIVATPIGNLGDTSFRAIASLACADILLCEDTRRTNKLLSHFGISRKLSVYEEHSAYRVRPQVLKRLSAGCSVALVSDAGTPLISDPGYKLVREAIAADIPVFSVPGAVAAVAALTISGLPTDRFLFAGFLPAKSGARRQRLSALAQVDATLIFYETATRLRSFLRDTESLLTNREFTIVREITKQFEERYSGDAATLLRSLNFDILKGELVVVAGPPQPTDLDDELILQKLDEAMATMSSKDAVTSLAATFNVPRKRVYKLMVARTRASG